jgi:hypothetical protein
MPKLAIRHVEHDSVINICQVSIAREKDELRVSVDEFLDEPRTRNAVHFNFLASDPFHELNFGRGSLVLVCSRCRRSLRCPPNLYSSCGRAHWRRARRFCCRSQCCGIHFPLSCISLVKRNLESKIQRGRVQLFPSHRSLCRSRHDRVLSSFSTRWSAIRCSGYFSRRRGHHGDRWHLVFPRSTIVAAVTWHHVRNRWVVFVAEMNPFSGRITLHHATPEHQPP